MKNFEKNYENFNSRKPSPRLGGFLDYTKMRFIDTATKEEILKEYEIIKNKQSKLSSKERLLIIEMVEN